MDVGAEPCTVVVVLEAKTLPVRVVTFHLAKRPINRVASALIANGCATRTSRGRVTRAYRRVP